MGWISDLGRTLLWPPLECFTLGLARAFRSRHNAEYFAIQARRHLAAGRWLTAIHYGRAAVASDPTYAHAYRMLAFAYFRAGNTERARRTYERGVRVGRHDPAFVYTGDLERELREYERADNRYKRLLELEPLPPERWPPRGLTPRLRLRLALALAALSKSVRRWLLWRGVGP